MVNDRVDRDVNVTDRPFVTLVLVQTRTSVAVVVLTISIAEEEKASGLRAFVVLPPSVDTERDAQDSEDRELHVSASAPKTVGPAKSLNAPL